MSFDFGPIQTLGFSVLVLYIGTFLIARLRFLSENSIPVPVVGGFLFALLASLLLGQFSIRFGFDMTMKEPMMLAFFSCVGLGADMRMLSTGGKQLLLFILACLLYLIIQDGIGLLTAVSLDMHPLVGLLSGSITLSGGHATGAAYAQQFHDSSNIAGAMELAMAVATFGLILGGIIGGPVAGRLIKKHNISLPHKATDEHGSVLQHDDSTYDPVDEDNFLKAFFYVLLCMIFGKLISTWFAANVMMLPDIFWCMFVGVIIRNITIHDSLPSAHQPSVDMIGNISLSLFLVMALMSLNLWGMLSLAGPLLVLLAHSGWHGAVLQLRDRGSWAGSQCSNHRRWTLWFRRRDTDSGRQYECVDQTDLPVCRRHSSGGAVDGAFFIDLLNAIVIQVYLTLPVFGMGN